MKKGLINYSALTRLIAKELKIEKKTSFDAILIACRRTSEKLKHESQEEKVIAILKKSKLEIKNRIIAVVLEKGLYLNDMLSLEKEARKKQEPFHIIEGANAITIITSEEFLEKIENLFKTKVIKTNKQLVEIIIKSPKEIENTSSVVSYLYSLFGEHGINIVETMSCWTDTIFVIKEDDTAKAMSVLKF